MRNQGQRDLQSHRVATHKEIVGNKRCLIPLRLLGKDRAAGRLAQVLFKHD